MNMRPPKNREEGLYAKVSATLDFPRSHPHGHLPSSDVPFSGHAPCELNAGHVSGKEALTRDSTRCIQMEASVTTVKDLSRLRSARMFRSSPVHPKNRKERKLFIIMGELRTLTRRREHRNHHEPIGTCSITRGAFAESFSLRTPKHDNPGCDRVSRYPPKGTHNLSTDGNAKP